MLRVWRCAGEQTAALTALEEDALGRAEGWVNGAAALGVSQWVQGPESSVPCASPEKLKVSRPHMEAPSWISQDSDGSLILLPLCLAASFSVVPQEPGA